MAKIQNWSQTVNRNVSDILGLAGEVRAWEHDETGDTVTVHIDKEDDFYGISYNGEMVTARYTLSDATDEARITLRNNLEGICT